MKKLSTKIGLGYLVVICINLALAIFAIYHINRLGSPIDRILREHYLNVNAAENMLQTLAQQEFANYAMLTQGVDSTALSNFFTYRNEFYNWHQRAIENIALPQEPEILDSILIYYGRFVRLSDAFQARAAGDTAGEGVAELLKNQVMVELRNAVRLTQRVRNLHRTEIARADSRARQASSRASYVIVVMSIIAVLLSVAASVQFTQNIIKPVLKTTESVKRISGGQLNQKVEITTDDEIAELGREFNKMTERLQAYEEMNIHEILLEKKKSEAIVAGIPAAIIVTNESHELLLMNEQAIRILNVGARPWRHQPVSSIVSHNELLELLTSDKDAAQHDGRPYHSLLILFQGEEEKYFSSRQIRIADAENNLLGLVTLLQDVTRFKNLDRLKSEFMATISHEFRTPLTSINMSIDILTREVLGGINEKQKGLLQDAKRDCQRLRKLVSDLLDLSRLESGSHPFNFQNIAARDLFEYALQPLQLRLQERSIQLDIDVGQSLPCVSGDLYHLSRVVTNLVDNALRYTPRNGRISLEATRQNGEVCFCVADNGTGIPEEAIDIIFDKFVQVNQFKDAPKDHIGLGLAISREIIDAHSGKIWVESQLGQGSRFYFTIPVLRK